MSRPIAIAVDGPGSSGKGTVARKVARALGYQYVDTGAMYRAVALLADRRGVAWTNEAALVALTAGLDFRFVWDGESLRVLVDGEDVSAPIRIDAIGQGASRVSALPGVRAALLDLQRALGAAGGVVMDGRDIGTVVLPDAELKIYLDATLEERAARRHDELVRRGEVVSLHEVATKLAERDRLDMKREVAPLRAADDAVHLDTTELTPRQALDAVLRLVQQRVGSLPR